MKRKKKKNNKIIIILLIILLIIVVSGYFIYNWYLETEKEKEYQAYLKNIRDSYNQYVVTDKETKLYCLDEKKYQVCGNISNMEIELVKLDKEKIEEEYFKLNNIDYYVNYKDINIIDNLSEIDTHYKNYIVFNENIVTNENTKLYINEDIYYQTSNSLSLPIIIKDNDKYYVEYDKKLVYINKSDVKEIINSNNTELGHTSGIAVLNYHYVINKEAGEHLECTQIICHTDTQFDSHIKYISDNGFYTATLRDLELFIEGKIQLPTKTVMITLDDGWYIYRAISILEKYKAHGVLFLITSLVNPSEYTSEYLEIASHTNDLHKYWGNFVESSKEVIMADLAKSREMLNNTTYFCYPFYQYNNTIISYLQEAGFTMSFASGNRKVRVGENKYIVPRYGIINTTTVNEIANIIN